MSHIVTVGDIAPPLGEDTAFLAAWRAVTSPRSGFAQDYFAGLGFRSAPVSGPKSGLP